MICDVVPPSPPVAARRRARRLTSSSPPSSSALSWRPPCPSSCSSFHLSWGCDHGRKARQGSEPDEIFFVRNRARRAVRWRWPVRWRPAPASVRPASACTMPSRWMHLLVVRRQRQRRGARLRIAAASSPGLGLIDGQPRHCPRVRRADRHFGFRLGHRPPVRRRAHRAAVPCVRIGVAQIAVGHGAQSAGSAASLRRRPRLWRSRPGRNRSSPCSRTFRRAAEWRWRARNNSSARLRVAELLRRGAGAGEGDRRGRRQRERLFERGERLLVARGVVQRDAPCRCARRPRSAEAP